MHTWMDSSYEDGRNDRSRTLELTEVITTVNTFVVNFLSFVNSVDFSCILNRSVLLYSLVLIAFQPIVSIVHVQ